MGVKFNSTVWQLNCALRGSFFFRASTNSSSPPTIREPTEAFGFFPFMFLPRWGSSFLRDDALGELLLDSLEQPPDGLLLVGCEVVLLVLRIGDDEEDDLLLFQESVTHAG